MFVISDRALNLLCNALYCLPNWFGLLTQYGFASKADLVDVLEMGEASGEAAFYSRDQLFSYLRTAKENNPDQIQIFCNELVRNKDNFAKNQETKESFLDALAQFEVQLGQEGFDFDGFQFMRTKPLPSTTQLADESLSQFYRHVSGIKFSQSQADITKAVDDLNRRDFDGCLTNLRLAVKGMLQVIAEEVAVRICKKLSSDKEDYIRNFLKDVGFLTEEEWNGCRGIYGLLSMGPHGKSDQESALLSYSACLMLLNYLGKKFRNLP